LHDKPCPEVVLHEPDLPFQVFPAKRVGFGKGEGFKLTPDLLGQESKGEGPPLELIPSFLQKRQEFMGRAHDLPGTAQMQGSGKRAEFLSQRFEFFRRVRAPTTQGLVGVDYLFGDEFGVPTLKQGLGSARPVQKFQKGRQIENGRSVIFVPRLKSPIDNVRNRHLLRPPKVSSDGENNHRDGAEGMGGVQQDRVSFTYRVGYMVEDLPQFLFRAAFGDRDELDGISQETS